jgi:hypothetical protein
MSARLAADAIVVVHLLFVAFVVGGGLLAVRNPAWSLLHLPAVAWGAYAELTATLCPLTPLENRLRAVTGQAGYAGGFVEHYLLPALYPVGLTPAHQWAIGWAVLALNAALYAAVLRRIAAKRRSRGIERRRR